MTPDLWYPLTASPLYLLGVLLAGLLVFDLLFVRVLKLGKIAWKRVDYIWLTAAALGLIGSATEVRRAIAAAALESRTTVAEDSYSLLREQLQFMTGPAVCITFQRSPLSPSNLQQLQDEYDAACEFAKRAMVALPNTPSAFDSKMLQLRRPAMTDPVLLSIFGALDRAVESHLLYTRRAAETATAANRSPGEIAFAASASFILTLALALRITKVTGEIQIERRGA